MLRLHFFKEFLEAGADEAGRGCLAGPVTCAAIILSNATLHENDTVKGGEKLWYEMLNDSKKLSKKSRETLQTFIRQNATSFAVVHIAAKKIDEINILQASILGMQKAVLQLNVRPGHVIVDGNIFNSGVHLPKQHRHSFIDVQNATANLQDVFQALNDKIAYTTIIKGDEKYMSIAAASIVAKTQRDAYMESIHNEYPMYNWKQNKGYPTKEHKLAIQKYGVTKYHRLTFKNEL